MPHRLHRDLLVPSLPAMRSSSFSKMFRDGNLIWYLVYQFLRGTSILLFFNVTVKNTARHIEPQSKNVNGALVHAATVPANMLPNGVKPPKDMV